ncbi:cobalamin biosynthesis protein CbiX [Thiohalorhabdus methylotrophus]|uniref:Cobalamin biosynthesis protein CbiX n=1 Tax=Thiohalorhabdus methylotrophus TaxID=3242694 RepID=A0ABV4TWH4_9GAMM
MIRAIWVLALLVAPGFSSTTLAGEAAHGFVLAVPDRGFLGNEQARRVFDKLSERHPARLLFVTDDRTGDMLASDVEDLRKQVSAVTVLPLFLSEGSPAFDTLEVVMAGLKADTVDRGRVFGRSYLAVEVLADRLRNVRSPADKHLVVAGYGAGDKASCGAMREGLARLARQAARGFGFASVTAEVWPAHGKAGDTRCAGATVRGLRQGPEPKVLAPFHLGPKYDSRMNVTASWQRRMGDKGRVLSGLLPHDAVATWALREANRHLPLAADDIGVLFHAHGADYHWNERMRRAAAGLAEDYRLDFAFSMADQRTIEPAVERLEAKGARLILLVRVFGRETSFRDTIRRMLGRDIEGTGGVAAAGGMVGHGGSSGPPPKRIRTTAQALTVGGLGAHPLFARALLDRAQAHSSDPERESVILVAHGVGQDKANKAWLETLERLAERMRAHGGDAFRHIRVATWREDWSEKRQAAVGRVRELVRQAAADGGRAIVVPARTTGTGHAEEFLKGLELELGKGFVPHPLFEDWLREQVAAGLETYREALGGRLTSALRKAAKAAQGSGR